jgi:ATP-dependent DNA ligase
VLYRALPLASARAVRSSRVVFELKWDGWRCIAHITASGVQYNRHAQGLTSTSASTASPLTCKAAVRAECVLDGEIVCLDPGTAAGLRLPPTTRGFLFVASDILEFRGQDLREERLLQLKRVVHETVTPGRVLCPQQTDAARTALASMCAI